MKLIHFKKHSCVSVRDYNLARENFNSPVAINPASVVAVFPRRSTKGDTSDCVISSETWCEVYTITGRVWGVDGTYEEVIAKLSQ